MLHGCNVKCSYHLPGRTAEWWALGWERKDVRGVPDTPNSGDRVAKKQPTRGAKVKALRKAAHLRQQDLARLLAERLGEPVSRQWVQQLENDTMSKEKIRHERILAVAEVLGVSAVEFLEDKQSKELAAEMKLILELNKARAAGVRSVHMRGFATSDLADDVLRLAEEIQAVRRELLADEPAEPGTMIFRPPGKS
jgi:transcriptional regulator with XRE-family HTH domain